MKTFCNPSLPYPFDSPARWGARDRIGTGDDYMSGPIDVSYPNLLTLLKDVIDGGRAPSMAFLIWYLENFYRLDREEAVDAVGDKPGDKGVDGVLVNDHDLTITVFQSRITQDPTKTVGDATLRAFGGTMRQFDSQASLEAMLAASGKSTIATLIRELDVASKIGRYQVHGEFLSCLNIDKNGTEYLKCTPEITFVGKRYLEENYISDVREIPIHKSVSFDIANYKPSKYSVDPRIIALIAPIKASELVKLDGIANQSLFALNVRGPLNKTPVNKDIEISVRDPTKHELFPLFHNGITIIAGSVKLTPKRITIEDYYVVNGCQSLTTLFRNQNYLTDKLRILTKIIQLTRQSPLATQITKNSNNQNGIKPRDFMSNTAIQIRLQNDFRDKYKDEYVLEIKRGEELGPGIRISNELAGLYLLAFDLKEPWATHRRYQVFDERHQLVFGRQEVTADRILMCHMMMEAINAASVEIKNRLCAKYVLTGYLMLYCIRLLCENDPISEELLQHPENFVRTIEHREAFRKCMRQVADDIVIELNAELEEFGVDFDYRDKMRDTSWVRSISRSIVTTHNKLVRRKAVLSIKQQWNAGQ